LGKSISKFEAKHKAINLIAAAIASFDSKSNIEIVVIAASDSFA